MLRKEFRDSLRILFHSTIILVALPITGLLSLLFNIDIGFVEILQISLLGVVFIFAIYSGISLFQSEQMDRGFEYLLTLPLSKSAIFIFKVIPRLVILSVLSGLVFGLMKLFNHDYVLGFKGGRELKVIMIIFFLHLGALFLSLAFDSTMAAGVTYFLLFGMSGLFYLFLFHIISELSILPFLARSLLKTYALLITALLILIPLAFSFFLTFWRLDFKPLKLRIRPYLFISLPVFSILSILILIFFNKFIHLF